MDPVFSAGGLASGLDTNTMVEKLVQLESRPIDILRRRQAAVRSRISALGDIASKLSALGEAAKALSTGGVLALEASSTHTSFGATPGTSAVAGSYKVQVNALAAAAKARSQAFGATDSVTGGTLTITIEGKGYDVAIADGAQLADVAFSIRQSGAPVTAVVLDDGTNKYLSVTRTATGFPIGGAPSAALSIVHHATGVVGKPLSATGANGDYTLAITQAAANAAFAIDDLPFARTSNTASDAVPGTTLALKSTGAAETLLLSNDVEATQANLKKFVDAYNAVLSVVQKQLDVTPQTDRSGTLAGDGAIRDLQGRLQSLTSAILPGLTQVRSLADLGIKTARDGSLSIDATVLASAVAKDPAAVNALFSTATSGIADLAGSLVDGYARAGDGVLSTRRSGLESQVKRMDEQAATLQRRVDTFRQNLVRQFTAMEKVVSQLRNIGTFLNQQTAASSASK